MSNRIITTGISLASLLPLGCTGPAFTERPAVRIDPMWDTNAASHLQESSFGDTHFDSSRSEVKLPTGIYVFMPIPKDSEVKDHTGRVIPNEAVFPYCAVRTNEMTEEVDPDKNKVIYGRPDKTVRLFIDSGQMFEKGIESVGSNIGFTKKQLPEGVRVGNVSESEFFVPAINFGEQMDLVPYAVMKDPLSGAHNIILVGNGSGARFSLNHPRKLIDFFSSTGFYVEEDGGTVKEYEHGIRPEQIFEAEIRYLKAPTTQPKTRPIRRPVPSFLDRPNTSAMPIQPGEVTIPNFEPQKSP